MAQVGVDCQIILDSQGYLVAPHSYQMDRPRLRKASITIGGAERWVDLGPGKHVWKFTVLALNDLANFAGVSLGMTGQQIHDALSASYARVATTLAFTDLYNLTWTVRFDALSEVVRDPRTQLTAPGYLMAVVLVEA